MSMITATEAKSNLFRLLDELEVTHQPILIQGERSNAVLLAEADWQAINETLYLLSVPGMRESILEGMNTAVDECSEDLDW
jgi:antitoxin YefM